MVSFRFGTQLPDAHRPRAHRRRLHLLRVHGRRHALPLLVITVSYHSFVNNVSLTHGLVNAAFSCGIRNPTKSLPSRCTRPNWWRTPASDCLPSVPVNKEDVPVSLPCPLSIFFLPTSSPNQSLVAERNEKGLCIGRDDVALIRSHSRHSWINNK